MVDENDPIKATYATAPEVQSLPEKSIQFWAELKGHSD